MVLWNGRKRRSDTSDIETHWLCHRRRASGRLFFGDREKRDEKLDRIHGYGLHVARSEASLQIDSECTIIMPCSNVARVCFGLTRCVIIVNNVFD